MLRMSSFVTTTSLASSSSSITSTGALTGLYLDDTRPLYSMKSDCAGVAPSGMSSTISMPSRKSTRAAMPFAGPDSAGRGAARLNGERIALSK
eukprot:129283-Hanusia_phi.AAC.3